MPPRNLDHLTRTFTHDGRDLVVMRPGLALVLFSSSDLAAVMSAAAEVLDAYLDFVPPGAILSTYEPAPEDDEDTPGRWVVFDAGARARLLGDLRTGPSRDDAGYSFALSSTADGQAGEYGVSFAGINFDVEDDCDDATSLLRLELPWDLLDSVDVKRLLDLVERAALLFPFCSGHAGLAFNHTISYVPEAREEIGRLSRRFLGFDAAFSSVKVEMRGKSPPAHWLNLLGGDLVAALGGEAKLRKDLDGCEVKSLGGGLLVRAARWPPVVDVNRRGLDIGLLPVVARAIAPVRFDEGMFVGIGDDAAGRAWLERFDRRAARVWDNG